MSDLSRRDVLKWATGTTIALSSGCAKRPAEQSAPHEPQPKSEVSPVQSVEPLPTMGPWPTVDPFLFCVHHNDRYPAGNAACGPDASLRGRDLGQDFSGRDGWSMYHGAQVPGFPRHPHRGFETITVVQEGLIDHADSLGAGARYGDGDVQWLTAGDGIVHAEMFPLLRRAQPNPVDFFQIWINLPAARKRAKPHFSMLWRDAIPILKIPDASGLETRVKVVAGAYGETASPSPPPDSWAADPSNHVAVWHIRIPQGGAWHLPSAMEGIKRTLYTVRGPSITCGGQRVAGRHLVRLGTESAQIASPEGPAELLLLQGRPIGEPVARYGPFVMNTMQEIQQAASDYRRTQFGGWPWKRDDPVHGQETKRFARRPGLGEETPG